MSLVIDPNAVYLDLLANYDCLLDSIGHIAGWLELEQGMTTGVFEKSLEILGICPTMWAAVEREAEERANTAAADAAGFRQRLAQADFGSSVH